MLFRSERDGFEEVRSFLVGMEKRLVSHTDQKLGELREELRGELGELRGELRGELGELRGELREELQGAEQRLRQDMGSIWGALVRSQPDDLIFIDSLPLLAQKCGLSCGPAEMQHLCSALAAKVRCT